MSLRHYHPSIGLHGQIYDLAHLDPFRFEANSMKVARALRINVRFTNHCYSETFDPVRHDEHEPVIMDGQRRRAFCPVRYALSHHLPGLIGSPANPGARVHETASRRNWMYAVTLELGAEGVRYQIFFDLRRTIEERRQFQDLDMVVESAYPGTPERSAPNVLGRVNFLLLAGSVYVGKTVTTRR